jgi:uncharacterized protein YjbJ (UPF0337 family)
VGQTLYQRRAAGCPLAARRLHPFIPGLNIPLTRRTHMNWDQVEGKWQQLKGKVRAKWGKLTDDDLQVIGGKKDQLLGKLQERYGYAREKAEKDLEEAIHTF